MLALVICTQFDLADSLYANRYFDLAAVEYERAFFFHPDLNKDVNPRLRRAVALCRSDHPSGYEELAKVEQEFPGMEAESKAAIATFYLQEGRYGRAAEILAGTGEHRLLGYALLLDGRLDDARDFYLGHGEDKLGAEVSAFLAKPKKSVLTATVLSICPGLGEIYGGNTSRGIIDFLLTAGTGYLIYDAFRDRRYVDAGLVFSFLFNRFYLGSMANAQRAVLDDNERYRTGWFKRIESEYYPDLSE